MDVKACRGCGALFHHLVGPPLCQKCKKQDEEDFQRVKEYLYDNPGAAMSTVCDELGVTVKQVRHYLREGRLSVSVDSPIGIECERCNVKITSGRYCESCISAMSNQFSATAKGMQKEQPEKKTGKQQDKMRYLDAGTLKRRGRY